MTWHKNDKIMTKIVKTHEAPQPSKKKDIYLALLGSIVSQQLSTKVADVIFKRFLALFPDEYPDAVKLLKMKDEKLRAVGLSFGKIKYIKNIAQAHVEHPITLQRYAKMTDEAIIAELTQIKGVGTWTVQMLLMFPMDRPDVFPIGDLGIRQAMIEFYGVTETGKAQHARLHEIADSWRPNRTLACKYLWRARDLSKKIVKSPKRPLKKAVKVKNYP